MSSEVRIEREIIGRKERFTVWTKSGFAVFHSIKAAKAFVADEVVA